MTPEDARSFAVRWAEAWNNRDIEAVLVDFHDNVIFTSPTALAVVGVSTLRGKQPLRAYWTTALGRISSLRFSIDRVLCDPEHREVAIIYTSQIDGTTRRVSENLTFDTSGRVVAAEVFHGAAEQR
jgi:steroid delta-isomerase